MFCVLQLFVGGEPEQDCGARGGHHQDAAGVRDPALPEERHPRGAAQEKGEQQWVVVICFWSDLIDGECRFCDDALTCDGLRL